MLLTKEVEVNISNRNIKYYKRKNYICKYGDKIKIKIEDLMLGSRCEIKVLCDYCKQNIIKTQYNQYNKRKRDCVIKKDSCIKCFNIKTQEANIINYGVKFTLQRKDIIEKIKNSRSTPNSIISLQFKNKNYLLISKWDATNHTKLEFTCNKHIYCGLQETTYKNFKRDNNSCKQCRKEYLSNLYSNENCFKNLSLYLRDKISDWKISSMTASNYKCIITNKRFDDIHHLYGLNNIIKEIFQEVNIPIHKNIKLYSNEELFVLVEKCIEIHNRYPLGVCLCKKVHNQFHKKYGYGSNTPKQFEEFKNNFTINNNINISQKII